MKYTHIAGIQMLQASVKNTLQLDDVNKEIIVFETTYKWNNTTQKPLRMFFLMIFDNILK